MSRRSPSPRSFALAALFGVSAIGALSPVGIAAAQDAYDAAPPASEPAAKKPAIAKKPSAPALPVAIPPAAAKPGAVIPAPAKPGAVIPAPAKPGAVPPGMEGLPAWHPPITPPPSGREPMPVRPRSGVNQLLEQHVRERDEARAAGGVKPTPAAKKFPRDAHGYCIGQGPTSRPPNINILHGYLGANNDKAVPAPPRHGGREWFGSRWFGSLDWWQWRLTPYPWRYENDDDTCDPRNQPIPLIANLINFAALVFLFVRFGKKPLLLALQKRKASVMAEIDRAAAIQASAVARVNEYEGELAHLDDKLVTLREQYTLEGEHEEKRLRAELASRRERMMTDVAFRLEQEGKTTREQLSQQALREALVAAEDLLAKKITASDHERLAEEFLAALGPALQRGTATSSGGVR
ncbi:MAG: hypothetical protein EXR75_03600 [Myxococcales bacterium]|nr:hypothetical protein [Myxococcales bacterium]